MILAPVLRPLSVGLDDIRFPEPPVNETFDRNKRIQPISVHFFSPQPYIEPYFLSLRLRNEQNLGVSQHQPPLATPVAKHSSLKDALASLSRVEEVPDWKTTYGVPEIPGLFAHEVIQYFNFLSLFSHCFTFKEKVDILEGAADTFWDILSRQDAEVIEEDTWCFVPDITSSAEPSSPAAYSEPPLLSSRSSSSSSSFASRENSIGSSIWDNTPSLELPATAPPSARHRTLSPGLPPVQGSPGEAIGGGYKMSRSISYPPSASHPSLPSSAHVSTTAPVIPVDKGSPHESSMSDEKTPSDVPHDAVPTGRELLMAAALAEASPRSTRSSFSASFGSHNRLPTFPPVPRVSGNRWLQMTGINAQSADHSVAGGNPDAMNATFDTGSSSGPGPGGRDPLVSAIGVTAEPSPSPNPNSINDIQVAQLPTPPRPEIISPPPMMDAGLSDEWEFC